MHTATLGTVNHTPLVRRIQAALTGVLLLCVYGAWAGLTYFAGALPWWLVAFAGSYVVCLHGSLQHEAVHGHVARGDKWNVALMMWPLSLWIPFTRYRTLHRVHHACERLTDPVDDPETCYWTPAAWQRFGPVGRALRTANQTLAGRLLLGPFMVIWVFWRREAILIAAGNRRIAAEWLLHLLGVAAVLAWVLAVCKLPIWQYLVLFVWPSLSLTLLRSYMEHRPDTSQERRTALVEGSFATRLLFLNNNFHLVHHVHPELPWYAIGKAYRARRDEWLERNGGFHFPGYWAIARRYLFRPKDSPVQPHRTEGLHRGFDPGSA